MKKAINKFLDKKINKELGKLKECRKEREKAIKTLEDFNSNFEFSKLNEVSNQVKILRDLTIKEDNIQNKYESLLLIKTIFNLKENLA